MPQSSALLLWLLVRAVLAPTDPATLVPADGVWPGSRSADAWLETTAPHLVSDRFDAGGLSIGRPARIGVHGISAADTTYEIAGLEATSVLRPGMPMVLPETAGAASIDVTRLSGDVSTGSAGPRIRWTPLSGATRIGEVEGYLMPASFAITPSATGAQPLAQLRKMADGSVVLAGGLTPRATAMFAGRWASAARVDRSDPAVRTAELKSFAAHLRYAPSALEEATATVLGQAVSDAGAADRYGLAQGTWRRVGARGASLSVAGGYQWTTVGGPRTSLRQIDTALDGSAFPALFRPAGREHVWRGRAELSTGERRWLGATHILRIGGSASRSAVTPDLATAETLVETVNGAAARVWRVDLPATAPAWTVTTAAAYAGNRMRIGQGSHLDAGLRVETLRASNGGATSIAWTSVTPQASLLIADAASGLGVFAAYTRAGAPLPAMALAFGDANAPSARVFRWMDANANGQVDGTEAALPSSLVMRAGPGAAGGVTAIDPALRRPMIDQFVGGVRLDRARVGLAVAAIVRRQDGYVRGVADGGAAYAAVTQADPNADFTHPSDDQQLTGYSRVPASFGLDHYTLTNPANAGEATSYALDVTAQYRGTRMRLAFSAAAIAAKGAGANRGFRVDENDYNLIGDVFMNPNATTSATGARTFFDRGYVGKLLGSFELGWGATLSVVSRYQDGQPFSRLAVFTTLAQGPEAVMGYTAGRPTRFTYIGTTDARLAKRWGRLTLMVDGFNLFNIGREVEEYVLTNPNFRAITCIEPPRTVRAGFRFAF